MSEIKILLDKNLKLIEFHKNKVEEWDEVIERVSKIGGYDITSLKTELQKHVSAIEKLTIERKEMLYGNKVYGETASELVEELFALDFDNKLEQNSKLQTFTSESDSDKASLKESSSDNLGNRVFKLEDEMKSLISLVTKQTESINSLGDAVIALVKTSEGE
jgi:hypothetical protein